MTDPKDWRTELVSAHPVLFHAPIGAPQAGPGLPECGAGWSPLLDRTASRSARGAGRARYVPGLPKSRRSSEPCWEVVCFPEEVEVEVVQAIDWRKPLDVHVRGVRRSGHPYRSGAWPMTRYAAHSRGTPGRDEAGPRERPYLGADRRPIVRCRRYDRESDRFLDIDPASLGVRTSAWPGIAAASPERGAPSSTTRALAASPSAIRSRRFVTLWSNCRTAPLARRRSARWSEFRRRSPNLCRRLLGTGCPCRLPNRAPDGVR
jgi:hypothetical protein